MRRDGSSQIKKKKVSRMVFGRLLLRVVSVMAVVTRCCLLVVGKRCLLARRQSN